MVIGLVLLYAYAIDVTNVDLQEPLEPQRQNNLVEMLRELARPDIFAHDTETRSTALSIRMPCPEEVRGSQISLEGRQLTFTPNCVTTTQDFVTLEGQGFQPNATGYIRWIPIGSTTTRRLIEIRIDRNGNFTSRFTFPDVRPSEEPQRLDVVEITAQRIVGLSDTAILALEKIVETVLMALIASTIGTLIAIPVSFMAARNLMADVKSPLAAVMFSMIIAPILAGAGWWVTARLIQLAALVRENPWLGLGSLLVTVALTVVALRLSANILLNDSSQDRAGSALIGLASVLGLLSLVLLGQLGLVAGAWLESQLGVFGFIGNFIFVMSDLIPLLLPLAVGFIAALAGINVGSKIGQNAVLRTSESNARILTAVVTVVGTTILLFLLIYALTWINLLGIRDYVPNTLAGQVRSLGIPVAVISILAALLSLRTEARREIPIGLTIYTATRSTLNALRSIEPIMMGFVFVIWVGLGPFAGIMALMLHSVADLGKLFSEQVEDIDDGPREAIRATGANDVQSVVYAVIPQITPHYIAYIFYRWDINVRLSTIIGFVGGGGIGFVLQQFLNQLRYPQASVMIVAIAIVVAALDFVSSSVRTRIR